MKKARNILIVALVICTALSMCVVGRTFAKYTSTFEGTSDTARVAKWAFEINDTAVTNSFTFDLFNTVNDTKDGNAEADVTSNNSDTVIAPGTKGFFEIKLANKSEVNAEYTVDYTITNTANIPVEFSIDGTNWTTDLADITTAVGINKGADTTIKVEWRWAFEGSESTNFTASQTDVTDTALGAAGTDTIIVKADITATQVD